ncbi:MAG: hypothetical protein AAB628_02135 [Patescibacteria group bacterium]
MSKEVSSSNKLKEITLSRRPLVRPERVRKYGGNITVVVAMDLKLGTFLFYRKKGSGWSFPWKFTKGNTIGTHLAGEIVHNQTGVQTLRHKTEELPVDEKNGRHSYLKIRIIVIPIRKDLQRTPKDCEIRYMSKDELSNEKISQLCRKVIQYIK